ncbi:hypothetical protein C1N74_01210 [Microbacterium sp. SGAir0570]|nr:hypothetical protein C1N74_01210 [Microbacterium sp. SGAir0570]
MTAAATGGLARIRRAGRRGRRLAGKARGGARRRDDRSRRAPHPLHSTSEQRHCPEHGERHDDRDHQSCPRDIGPASGHRSGESRYSE